GGEKRRLHLMKVLYENPNFLIFDEPTNDLDLPTLTVLENFLLNFQGCLIIVSHDRYFMDRIVGHILAFEGNGKIKNFTGNFSEYREQNKSISTENQEIKTEKTSEVSKNPQPNSRRKLSFKEQRELEQIENDMPKIEAERNKILEALNNESNYEKITTLSADLQRLSDQLEAMELRWLEFQEILEN
ncbi:MAG: ABC transporter ATP-binding protein, partial [Bergeyella zoohelcum]|nr:ABC transporter ATP-binding protein [Bergeyella zoohelcum]